MATNHELSSRKNEERLDSAIAKFKSKESFQQDLIEDIARTPFEGLGKPEALKHKYVGLWSRRIDSEHRLIYRYQDDEIHILKCRFHYD